MGWVWINIKTPNLGLGVGLGMKNLVGFEFVEAFLGPNPTVCIRSCCLLCANYLTRFFEWIERISANTFLNISSFVGFYALFSLVLVCCVFFSCIVLVYSSCAHAFNELFCLKKKIKLKQVNLLNISAPWILCY